MQEFWTSHDCQGELRPNIHERREKVSGIPNPDYRAMDIAAAMAVNDRLDAEDIASAERESLTQRDAHRNLKLLYSAIEILHLDVGIDVPTISKLRTAVDQHYMRRLATFRREAANV